MNSIPIDQALAAGARTIFVLQVGRIETPLVAPTSAVGAARVAFEIARRHRFARDLATLPEGVALHVLPSGGALEGDDGLMAYRRMETVHRRIDQAYEASRTFLRDRGLAGSRAGRRRAAPDGGGRLMRPPPKWVRRIVIAPIVVALGSSRSSLALTPVAADLPRAHLARARHVRTLRAWSGSRSSTWCGTPLLVVVLFVLWIASGFGWKLRAPGVPARALPPRGAWRCGCCSGSSARRCA